MSPASEHFFIFSLEVLEVDVDFADECRVEVDRNEEEADGGEVGEDGYVLVFVSPVAIQGHNGEADTDGKSDIAENGVIEPLNLVVVGWGRRAFALHYYIFANGSLSSLSSLCSLYLNDGYCKYIFTQDFKL